MAPEFYYLEFYDLRMLLIWILWHLSLPVMHASLRYSHKSLGSLFKLWLQGDFPLLPYFKLSVCQLFPLYFSPWCLLSLNISTTLLIAFCTRIKEAPPGQEFLFVWFTAVSPGPGTVLGTHRCSINIYWNIYKWVNYGWVRHCNCYIKVPYNHF